MGNSNPSIIGIVDYGMGNLFSVQQACARSGIRTLVTSDSSELLAVDGVILPGVGAFGDAMTSLEQMGLVKTLLDIAASGKPFLGICLGMQLLMTEGNEFGKQYGLGIIEGDVVRLSDSPHHYPPLKVPQVGWNQIYSEFVDHNGDSINRGSWDGTLLEGLCEGEYMYFVHSFYARPVNSKLIISKTFYGDNEFCSSFQQGNVFGCQFHPERSAERGMIVYRNLGKYVDFQLGKSQNV